MQKACHVTQTWNVHPKCYTNNLTKITKWAFKSKAFASKYFFKIPKRAPKVNIIAWLWKKVCKVSHHLQKLFTHPKKIATTHKKKIYTSHFMNKNFTPLSQILYEPSSRGLPLFATLFYTYTLVLLILPLLYTWLQYSLDPLRPNENAKYIWWLSGSGDIGFSMEATGPGPPLLLQSQEIGFNFTINF